MIPFHRLLIVIASALLFVWVCAQCLAGALMPPRLNLAAAWLNGELKVLWVRPAGEAWNDGIRPGARITSVDGHTPVPEESVIDAQRVEAVYNGEIRQTATVPTEQVLPQNIPALLTLAACFSIIEHWYFLIAYHRTWAWLVLLLCGSASYALVTSIATHSGTPLWAFSAVVLSILVFCNACLLFTLGFPVNQMEIPERKRLAITSVVTSVIIGLLYLYVVHYDTGHYDLFRRYLHAYYLVNFLGACLIGTFTFMEQRYRPHFAEALITLGVGLGLGVIPFCALVLLPNVIAGTELLSPYFVINSIVFFAFAVAIAATRLETYYAEERGAVGLWEDTLAEMKRQRELINSPPSPTDSPTSDDN